MVLDAGETSPLISVKELDFSYGTNQVLEKISLDILKGDFLALIGPNGSGKTTLIRIILGLLKQDSGSVSLMGQPGELFSQWSKLGYVPQKATHFDPFFPVSVEEVVSMGLLSAGSISRTRPRTFPDAIDAALDVVGMKDFRKHRIGHLSGGQQQRVFIARAVVNQPEVLFLDEPTTGVDSRIQEKFYDMLEKLNREKGITIVLVTHEIGVINRHIKKVACLNQRLIYHGTHREFCRTPEFSKVLSDGHHIISHRH